MAVARRLQISDRHIWNAIHEMVQRDVMKALVELLTNADDSYSRLEAAGRPVSGRIVVEIEEHRAGRASILRIRDDAEGFAMADLDRKVGRMGEATSGLVDGHRVRGMWGDGLKEAILGLGVGGQVVSVRGGEEVSCRLEWSISRRPLYRRPDAPVALGPGRRQALDLPGDGTLIEVFMAPGVCVPQHSTLVHRVGLHYALRDIVRRSDRTVLVRRVRGGVISHEDQVVFHDPVHDPQLDAVIAGTVPGFDDAPFTIELHRATEPLTGSDAGPYRLNGLLVQTHGALVDVSFFGHEHRAGTPHLFGRVVCDALYDRLREGEPVVARNRSGLSRENPFVKALVAAIDQAVGPYVLTEARRHDTAIVVGSAVRKRLDHAVVRLNRILGRELRRVAAVPQPELPFRLDRTRYRLHDATVVAVKLRVRRDAARPGDVVVFEVEGACAALEGPDRFIVPEHGGEQDGWVFETSVRGRESREIGLIHARAPGHEATALIAVDAPGPAPVVAFQQRRWRVPVGRRARIGLRVRAEALSDPGALTLTSERGTIRLVGEPLRVSEPFDDEEWLEVLADVHGEQVGAEDVIIARLGEAEVRTEVRVVARRPHGAPGVDEPITAIRFDDRPNPEHRFELRRTDGVITLFVNDPSLSRYLSAPADREAPVGRALVADLVVQAFCQHLAVRKWERVRGGEPAGDPVLSTVRLYASLVHCYGGPIHALLNPR